MPTNRDRLHRLIEKLCISRRFRPQHAPVPLLLRLQGRRLDGEGWPSSPANSQGNEKLPVKPTAIGGLTWEPTSSPRRHHAVDQTGGKVLKGSIARRSEEARTRRKIENELPRGTKIVAIDDVIRPGRRPLGVQGIRGSGYEIVGISPSSTGAGGKKTLEDNTST